MLSTKTTFVSVLIALLIVILAVLFRLDVDYLTDKEKCPACFGISVCEDIRNNKITFDWTDFYSIFNNLFGIKNVYYGNYKNKRVVMKKLATESELAAFDQIACTNTDTLKSCPFNTNAKFDFRALIKSELSNFNITDPNIKIHVCPTIEKINKLLQNVTKQLDAIDSADYLKYLWTTLKINPEPIVLQILNASDDWPTPKYYGACGRLIVEEFIGPPLSAFEIEPWIKRAKIASSLLNAANSLTFKNIDFAFYLTDISTDNIAVNKKDEAVFVDLENIIIVDKKPPLKIVSKLNSWNEIHSNDIDVDCQDCFVFSMSDICEHKISDHNFYAICQHILTQYSGSEIHSYGFLHNPPKYILKRYPLLKDLLKQCSRPDRLYSRIDSGRKLKQLLDTITSDVENYV